MPGYEESVFLEVSELIFSAWREGVSGSEVVEYVMSRSSVEEGAVREILAYISGNMGE